MAYKFLEHTADIGIEVSANNLKEAFLDAVFGLLELIFNKNFKDWDCKSESEIIEINSQDLDSLFVDTMNEILYLLDSKKIIPLKPEITEISNTSLRMKYNPFNFNYSELPMHLYVKAVTFHQLEILQTKEKTTIKFFVDI